MFLSHRRLTEYVPQNPLGMSVGVGTLTQIMMTVMIGV